MFINRLAFLAMAVAAVTPVTLCAANTLIRTGAPVSEIHVRLTLDTQEYLEGERVRAVVSVENGSPDDIVAGALNSRDKLQLELFRASDNQMIDRMNNKPVTVPFVLKSGEGQNFEVYFDRYFPIYRTTRYLARAVLIHNGTRYEGPLRSFDVVPGIKINGALQMFADRTDLRREISLVYWNRNKLEHLFLKVKDDGPEPRTWSTTDLGPILRVTKPRLSITPEGEVIVLHRASQDEFLRSEFWSLPEAFEFHERERMVDPDVAGSERVKALYKESSGVSPVKKAWWKFW